MKTLSNWAQHLEKRPSLLWLIERAPTLEMLEDLLMQAVKLKDASKETRHRWAKAAEYREFYLKRCPPSFEKVGIAEVFDAAALADPRLKMTTEEVISQVQELRHFKCAEDGVFSFTGMGGKTPLDAYFNAKEFIPAAGYRPVERFYVDTAGKKQDNQNPSVTK